MKDKLIRLPLDDAAFGDRRPVEMFAPGRFDIHGRQEVYDRDRIQAIVDKTRENAARFPTLRKIPVQVGHKASDVVGWVDPDELHVDEDGHLRGTVDITNPEHAAKAEDGTYRNVSVQFFSRDDRDESTGEPLGEALEHLAIVTKARNRQIRGFVFADEYESPEGDPSPPPDERGWFASGWQWLSGLLGRAPTPDEVEAAHAAFSAPDTEDGQEPPPDDREDDNVKNFTEALKAQFGLEATPKPEQIQALGEALRVDLGIEAPKEEPPTPDILNLPPEAKALFDAQAAKQAELEKQLADQRAEAEKERKERAAERRAAFEARIKERVEGLRDQGEIPPYRAEILIGMIPHLPAQTPVKARFGEDDERELEFAEALLEIAKLDRAAFEESGHVDIDPGGRAAMLDAGRKAAQEYTKATQTGGGGGDE